MSDIHDRYAFDMEDADESAVRTFLRNAVGRLFGLAILAFVAFGVVALSSWHVDDPSFSLATERLAKNTMGFPGAAFADIAVQFLGLATIVALLPAIAWGFLLAAARPIDKKAIRLAAWLGCIALAAAALACLPVHRAWPIPSGHGGVIGDMMLRLPAFAFGRPVAGWIAVVIGLLTSAGAIWLFTRAAIWSLLPALKPKLPEIEDEPETADDWDLDEPRDEPLWRRASLALLGALTHTFYKIRAGRKRSRMAQANRERLEPPRLRPANDRPAQRQPAVDWNDEREQELPDMPPDGLLIDDEDAAYLEDRKEASADTDEQDAPWDEDDGFLEDEDEAFADAEPDERVVPFRPQLVHSSEKQKKAEKPAAPAATRRAAAKPARSGKFELPSQRFLAEPKKQQSGIRVTEAQLADNARQLEAVLNDFGVKGEIMTVRPGPVVTLYELEPAPGVKSSRVIGLAEDIARSMSAIAARVAVVPGRNAIGIELPNDHRETVYLREIIGSKDFQQTKSKLGLSLGKTIGGEAVIADLAKMPHLLVAGTTGSGKSVAINTMILSLLYRMTPQQCRLIMIDPKMLELSVYDGIPHLLSPVVTDPKKAVVALKWTVREMEERYRKMSKVGVRNIDGFNSRVGEAKAKGETITRTVQTGFDRETGEAIYEHEEMDLDPMPYIVVIIDEMADLMMVAGKEIEGAVQRLAQMARAAGIHVIMATQRPSVDVITGTIKANFPTRISFQVTSKIDSRTILGEMGAEQLLGMGDMLYQAAGGRSQRVHGPFVSDEEVETVVNHLKTQGVPEYLDSVTEDTDDEDEGAGGSGGGGGDGPATDSDDPYDQAVAVVLRDGKASTSYIQRRLGIGYNRAATIIEKMEEEGVIGPADHAGKREILVPRDEFDD
ncbi:DNA translocase FtsK [Notoacmeibacter sp. MSK16QG-6]|uniref:FtsK/SpoIIIE family DNA translocase n=1 Tax=Notoacmeibacter sp. MSK16QG-6 TaxID=2957982 RepID=UPI00209FAAA0|nr:DNA translocase FtsK [Notoacmeibacter sp. MSK16QG-6]MCP1199262.1 DNA translocase FtsK [Notoacmeibacter sp. MSK16QG-6]